MTSENPRALALGGDLDKLDHLSSAIRFRLVHLVLIRRLCDITMNLPLELRTIIQENVISSATENTPVFLELPIFPDLSIVPPPSHTGLDEYFIPLNLGSKEDDRLGHDFLQDIIRLWYGLKEIRFRSGECFVSALDSDGWSMGLRPADLLRRVEIRLPIPNEDGMNYCSPDPADLDNLVQGLALLNRKPLVRIMLDCSRTSPGTLAYEQKAGCTAHAWSRELLDEKNQDPSNSVLEDTKRGLAVRLRTMLGDQAETYCLRVRRTMRKRDCVQCRENGVHSAIPLEMDGSRFKCEYDEMVKELENRTK